MLLYVLLQSQYIWHIKEIDIPQGKSFALVIDGNCSIFYTIALILSIDVLHSLYFKLISAIGTNPKAF